MGTGCACSSHPPHTVGLPAVQYVCGVDREGGRERGREREGGREGERERGRERERETEGWVERE